MSDPFGIWLNRLIGKNDVKILTHADGARVRYQGQVMLVEDELCLFKESGYISKKRDTLYLFPISDIIEISGDEELFEKCKSSRRKANKNLFWKWMKRIEGTNEEVTIVTRVPGDTIDYTGSIAMLETDLCLIKNNSWKQTIFRVKNVTEIRGDGLMSGLKSGVEIEEIEEEEETGT